MLKLEVINGNNLDFLKQYPDNYFDAVVTDPPYGLGKEPNATELMKDWIEHGYHEVKGTGFMGKEWDAFVPQPIFWKEVFRVLKHGGHVLSFFGTRTYDWGVMAMRFSGFEIRDCIQWIYGSGFPKSHNISKALDKMEGAERTEVIGQRKRNVKPFDDKNGWNDNNTSGNFDYTAPATESAKQWDGWGSSLKPASEPIVLARKPLEKGLSIADNVLKWGTGAINIDGCRVSTDDIVSNHSRSADSAISKGKYGDSKEPETHQTEGQKLGRFPANLIMSHHPECEYRGLKKIGSGKEGGYNYKGNEYEVQGFVPNNSPEANSNYGQETIEDWKCHEDCPIRIMDEQSLCGASRFFYCAKASKSERERGLKGFEKKQAGVKNSSGRGFLETNPMAEIMRFNDHPTVKPIKLMQYLVRLITPPNGKVLDPFCGSGTTGIACKLEGFEFVGIEQDPEYTKIAQARIDNYTEEPEPKHILNEDEVSENQLSLF